MGPPPGVEGDASPLNRERPIEIAQARIADAGVAQCCRIDGERVEVPERQHPFEPRQRLVPARPDDAAHAEIVERLSLVKSISGRRCLDRHGVQPSFAFRPLADPHSQLAVQPGDVELDVGSVRRESSRRFEGRESGLELIAAPLQHRLDELLTGTKGRVGRRRRKRRRDQRLDFRRLTLQDENFTAKETERPGPFRVGRRERHAALGERPRPGQFAAPFGELRLVQRGSKLPFAPSGAAADEDDKRDDQRKADTIRTRYRCFQPPRTRPSRRPANQARTAPW